MKFQHYNIVSIVSAVLLCCGICLFSACDNVDPDLPEETSFTQITTAAPKPEPFPITIGDITVSESPESVAILAPAIFEIVHELGYGGRVSGRGSYCDFPSDAANLPDIGSSANPDIEGIISLKPNVLLTSTPLAAKDLFALGQADVRVLVIPAATDITTFRDIYKAVGLLFEGAFTGENTGEKAFAPISRLLDNTKVVNIGRFLYITDFFTAATPDTLESAVFSCFGSNAAAGEDYDYDLALLAENQPDVIIVNDIYDMEDLAANPDIAGLNAFINGRVIFVDNTCFERPSARIVTVITGALADYAELG
jgi:iron complex transport system substrate-binding protein